MSGLQGAFIGVHFLLAQVTQSPELIIAPPEAEALQKAIQNVARHYSIDTTQKTIDWASLALVVGGVYGTRFVAIAQRRAMERAARRPRVVVPFGVPEGANGEAQAGPVPQDDFQPSVPGGPVDYDA